MSLASALSFYVATNLLIAVSYLVLRLVALFNSRSGRPFSSRTMLQLHTIAIVSIFTAPLAMSLVPRQPFFQPPAKIWSAPSMKQFASELTRGRGIADQPGYLLMSEGRRSTALSAANIFRVGVGVIALFLIAGISLFFRDMRRLVKIRNSSHLVRKIRRVVISVNENISVPFSYRTFRLANVIVPISLIAKPEQYRMAIQHELQHHRQGDTITVYAIWLLRLACVANPLIHVWSRELSEIQEFACDETLVDLEKVDSHAYARCLFEVAQTARGLERVPVCATGLTFKTDGPLLKRRINTMLFQKKTKRNQFVTWTAALALTAIMTLGAYASSGLVQDRRVSLDQAQKMVAELSTRSGSKAPSFPIAINDRVLRQLNRYIGTPEGRDFMRSALARMENERGPIEKAMKKYGVPLELLAIPIIESGYQNLPQVPGSRVKAAGLWQFIPRTAEVYGLRVDSTVDERLNIPLETDAAMRLLVANKMRFKDWMLSVSAYNAGENKVQEGIDKTGSRDAWVLAGKGFEGDHDYLAKLHAAILIMNNPDSVL